MTPWGWKRTSLGALTGLVAAGALYQLVSEARDKSKFPPPGDLVDVGGLRLHIYGTGKGSPTVVLDSGYADSCLAWSWVQPEIAKFTRVVSYDRAGLGWSDPGPKPRSSQKIVNELHRLLANAGVEGPYVMVGQSSGGMHVRLYAGQHPQDVVGMVLVDAAHEDWSKIKLQAPRRGRLREDLRQWVQLNPILARLGVLRLRGKPFGTVRGLPPNIQPIATALGLRSRAYDQDWGVMTAIQLSDSQLGNSPLLPDMPLAVLSAHIRHKPWGISAHEADRVWMALQEDLANLVPNSTRTVSEHGGHNLHIDDPGLVIDAIRQVVEAARHRA